MDAPFYSGKTIARQNLVEVLLGFPPHLHLARMGQADLAGSILE